MDEELDLQTVGDAAATYQRDPRQIEAGLRAVQAERAIAMGVAAPPVAVAALTLNGVAYFRCDEIAKAVAWLNGVRG